MYSSFSINAISLVITVVLFSIFNFTYESIKIPTKEIIKNNAVGLVSFGDSVKSLNNQEDLQSNKQESVEGNTEEIPFNWGIYIPKINVNAQISEGTTKEVMDKYVGHFVDTAVVKGNVCLGAHNRGYPVNYFENIKKLQKGDLIYYKKDNIIRKYSVEIVAIIKDTDWTYLENTEDNRITLITCVEGEPDFRRCIQATECSKNN